MNAVKAVPSTPPVLSLAVSLLSDPPSPSSSPVLGGAGGWRGSPHGGHHAGVVGVPERGVDGRGGGQDVSRVAEGGQVAHVRHVPCQGSGAEGGALVVHALGELLEAVRTLPALLAFVGHLAVAGLDAFFLHGEGSVYIVQLVIQAARVTHRVPVSVASPQRRCGCLAVGTTGPRSSGSGQSPFGLDERSVLPVHLVVQPAGVTQIVPGPVSPPQRGRRGPAVHAFSTF